MELEGSAERPADVAWHYWRWYVQKVAGNARLSLEQQRRKQNPGHLYDRMIAQTPRPTPCSRPSQHRGALTSCVDVSRALVNDELVSEDHRHHPNSWCDDCTDYVLTIVEVGKLELVSEDHRHHPNSWCDDCTDYVLSSRSASSTKRIAQ